MGWTRHRVENSSAVVMFMAKNPYRKLGKEKGEEYLEVRRQVALSYFNFPNANPLTLNIASLSTV